MASSFKNVPDKTLTQEETIDLIKSKASDLKPILRFPYGVCFTLLQNFKWDRAELLTAFFTSTNTLQFLSENGVVPEISETTVVIMDECPVCCMEGPLIELGCDHLTCRDCWKMYLKSKIDDGQCSIECMDANCKVTIDPLKVESLLGNDSVIRTYQKLIVDNHIEASSELIRCVDSGCGKIIRHNRQKSGLVCCPCGFQSCYLCGKEYHAPASCRQLEGWKKMYSENRPQEKLSSSDSASYEWIQKYTRQCPKCFIPLVKNGGCDIMRCKNRNCRNRFCWECNENINFLHDCRGYNFSKSILPIQYYRFSFMLKRFEEHNAQLEKDKNICAKALELMKTGDSSKDITLVQEMASTLLSSRRTLSYSYVLGFFRRSENFTSTFKQHVKQLEEWTNKLQKKLENLKTLRITNQRALFRDHISYVKSNQNTLLEFCERTNVTEDTEAQRLAEDIDFKYNSNFSDNLVEFGIFLIAMSLFLTVIAEVEVEKILVGKRTDGAMNQHRLRKLVLIVTLFSSRWESVVTSFVFTLSASKETMFNDPDSVTDQNLTDIQVIRELLSEAVLIDSVLNLNPETCFILLQKFKWDKQSLLDSYYASADTNEFLVENGIIPRDSENFTDEECTICYAIRRLTGLACHHFACRGCWSSYLKGKVKEGQSYIECMDSNCKLIVNHDSISRILTGSDLSAYKKLIADSYIETNTKFTRCLSSKCGKVIQRNENRSSVISCPCGHKSCFSCGEPSHFPVGCRQLQNWKKKKTLFNVREARCLDWMIANTKECPKCFTPIEKNGGCNQITCKNWKCSYQFCWLCLEKWNVKCYNCKNIPIRNGSVIRQNNLLRFFTHLKKFEEHQTKLNSEAPVIEKLKKQYKKQRNDTLEKAIDVLLDCRQTLIYSNILGYYMNRDEHFRVFEDAQKELEQDANQLFTVLKFYDVGVKATLDTMTTSLGNTHERFSDICSEGTVDEDGDDEEDNYIDFSYQRNEVLARIQRPLFNFSVFFSCAAALLLFAGLFTVWLNYYKK